MVVETRDPSTGIIRHEYGTNNPVQCRNNIEVCGMIDDWQVFGDTVKYLIDFNGYPIDILSTPTRTIMFCVNRHALYSYFELIKGDDAHSWAYENISKFDYAPKTK